MSKKAIVFLSGGVDSTTCLAIAKAAGYACYALTFDYDQRHRVEIEAAKKIATEFDVAAHWICPLNLALSQSSLTNKSITLSAADDLQTNTYVPARNTIFLAYAMSWAEDIGADVIYFGANADDKTQYPDCRPAYIHAFQKLLDVAMRVPGTLNIEAPLLNDHKADIIRKGLALGIDYELTWSCYDPTDAEQPCQLCAACQLRTRAFKEVSAE